MSETWIHFPVGYCFRRSTQDGCKSTYLPKCKDILVFNFHRIEIGHCVGKELIINYILSGGVSAREIHHVHNAISLSQLTQAKLLLGLHSSGLGLGGLRIDATVVFLYLWVKRVSGHLLLNFI